MLKIAQYICLILILLFLMASCGTDDKDNKDKNTTSNGTTDSGGLPNTEATDGKKTDNSPVQNVDFGKRPIRVFNANTGTSFFKESDTGEIVNDAEFNRNRALEEKLNVTFRHSYTPEGDSANDALTRLVAANLDEYDIAAVVQYEAVQLVTSNVFRDIGDLPYVDINDPWWATFYCEEIQIGKDTRFFLAGDWNLNMLGSQSAMFVNKNLYNNEFGDPNDMYQLVMDGKWTFDKYTDMSKVMYKDLDGDGKKTEGDQFGTAVIYPTVTNHLTFAAGIRYSERDDEGMPVIIIPSERNAKFTEMMSNLYYKNPGCLLAHTASGVDPIGYMQNMFAENRLLFYVGRFWDASGDTLKNMETDFMIIPYPKLEENMPQYYSLVHDGCPLLCVPTTSTLPDNIVGAIFTELSYLSHENVIPVYFDIALKGKYMRDYDQIAIDILDMIRQAATTDFAYIYNYALENIGNIMQDMMHSRSTRIVSLYAKSEGTVETKLQELIDAYLY